MLRERKDYPTAVTPKGVAIWPSLNTPDYKFKEEFGEYHCRLRLDPSAPGVAELIATAEEIRDEAYEAKKAELERDKKGALLKKLNKAEILRDEEDPETGEPTGFVILRAKCNAGGRRKKDDSVWKGRVDIFNAAGVQLKNPPKIGSGSELKLSVRIMEYLFPKDMTFGVSFELEGAQIIKLREGGQGQRSASDYGFGAEEGDDVQDQEGSSRGFNDESSGADDGDY